MRQKTARVTQWVLSVVLMVILMVSVVSGSVMKGGECKAAYKLTEEQLFMQCPWYLNNQMTEAYLTKCVDDTLESMDDVSSTEEFLASFMHGLRQGKSFILRDVASACGIRDSNYDVFKKEMAGELVRAYMGNSDAVSEIAGDISAEFSKIKRVDDIMTNAGKAIYLENISNACKGLSDEQVMTAVNAIYEHHDSISKFVSETIDIFDLVTGIIAMQELEVRVIDELILTQTGRADADLMDGLVALRYDITSGIGNYIVQNYCVEKVVEYLADMLIDAVKGLSSDAVNAITGKTFYFGFPQASLIKIAVKHIAAIYEKYRPSVNDIVHTTILYSYFKLFEGSVNQQYAKFMNKEGTTRDIETYQAAYKGQIVTIKLMMEKAKKLTDDKRLKNRLEMYAESLGQTITYEAYINGCLANATKDIDSGKLTITETSVVEKTEDGTIIDENYDSTASIAAKFAEIQKLYVPNVGQTWTGNWGGAIQCFGFARMVFSKLFGCEMPSAYLSSAKYQYASENNVNVVGQLVGSQVTVDNVKALAAKGKLGDIIQADGAVYGQHTMVFVSAESDGIKVYDCNANLHGISCEINQWTIGYDKLATWYGSSGAEGSNGITLYRASNYGKIYGNGDGLFYDDSVNFVINEEGVLTKYNGWQQFVEIPDSVTAIGDEAFRYNTTMISVEIPNSVKSIGNSAFERCTSLIGIVIPDSVESIGWSAFDECSSLRTAVLPQNSYLKKISSTTFADCSVLKEINIPDSVTEIGVQAFRNCAELEKVKLSNQLETLERNSFDGCKNLTSIHIPKSLKNGSCWGDYDDKGGIFTDCTSLKQVTFEEGIKEIASYLFWDCDSLENIEIPTTVSKIGSGAFGACDGLNEIKVPASVTKIEANAFEYCSNLENIVLSENITTIYSGTFQGCSQLQEIELPNSVTEIEEYAFSDCTELEKVKLSNHLERLGYSSFKNCKKLTSIHIPKSLKSGSSWGDYDDAGGIFTNCTLLKEVTFEEGITEIVNDLFFDCDSLENIEIPDTVSKIGNRAFGACDTLKEIKIPDNVTEIGQRAFEYCSHLEKITLSQNIAKISDNTFVNCSQLKEVEIPDSVIEIEAGAFYGCTELTKIKLSKNLETLGERSFRACKKLTSIHIPASLKNGASWVGWNTRHGIFSDCSLLKVVTFEEGITEIANDLFYDCDSLESIEIPDTVKVINAYAFGDCDALTEVIIPDGVTEIGNEAFKNCTHLEEITLPDTVNSMGTYVFGECSALTKVHLPEIGQNITEGTFYNCVKLNEVNFPDALKAVRSKAFYNCDALAEVNIPKNVTTIEKYAFQDCANLKTVTIPNAVTTIGSSAFQSCEALESISLGTGLTAISDSCFADCGKLTSMVLPYNVTTIGSKAFANSPKMLEIIIPWKTTSISSDAFSYKTKTTVYGTTGSYAETFANENNMTFVAKDIPATKVELNITKKLIDRNKELQLVADIEPASYNGEILWTSSDEEVAVVDENGLVTTKQYGTVEITISAGEFHKVCYLTVSDTANYSPVIDPENKTVTLTYAPENYSTGNEVYQQVYLIGNFPQCDWETGIPMTLDDNGNYKITLHGVETGDYYYQFKTENGSVFKDANNKKSKGNQSYLFMLTTETKKAAQENGVNAVRFQLPEGWGTPVCCYVYDAETETINNGSWPGQKMTKVEGTENIYEYVIPQNIKVPRVIFYYNSSKRYPADDGGTGLLFVEQNAVYMFSQGIWEKTDIVITPALTPTQVVKPTSKPTDVATITTKPTATPTITREAEVTNIPTVTKEAEITSAPQVTDTANLTGIPKVTDIGEMTKIPTVTSAAENTISPLPTEEIQATVTPVITSELEITISPTTTPKLTKTPVVTPNPTAPKTPTVTGTPTVYTIRYILNKGINNKANPKTYTTRDVTLKAPKRADYTFGGWYSDSKFRNAITTVIAVEKRNITVYAKWIKVTKPAKVVLKSAINQSGKKIKVTLKKKISKAKGYELCYTTDKKFKKSVKKVAFTKTSKTVSGLKKNKTYYVKVRAYKVDSTGKKIYGGYSRIEKVKIRK